MLNWPTHVLRGSWLVLCFLICSSDVACAQLEGQHVLEDVMAVTPGKSRLPNIVFILTDDQDLHMSSLDYMPHLQQHLIQEGTSFENHYCTVALCCPSRVSLWTGRHAHNTNVTDINPPHGGYPKFIAQGFNDNYFPLWMQDAGYDTYYVGRLINAQSITSHDKPHVRGWNASELFLDPYAYEYLNSTMQRNRQRHDEPDIHDPPRSYEGQYSTDVVAEKGLDFLKEAISERYDSNGRPFFLTIAPTSPHSNVHINVDLSDGKGKYAGNTATQSPPVAAKRHEHLFSDVVVPRTPNFNPDTPNSVSWLSTLTKQNQTNVDSNDHFYRQRLRALQAVDEIILQVMQALNETDILEQTYIFYSSDNGYHIGQHRLQPGKQCAFETDINVPMIVRGPGVGKGQTSNLVTTHTDLAPTFLSLAGVDVEARRDELALDGISLSLQSSFQFGAQSLPEGEHKESILKEKHDLTEAPLISDVISNSQEHVNIEMWGIIVPEGKYNMFLYPNHTYKALRIIAADNSYNLLYTVWCTNEHELYDLNADPYALHNIHPHPSNDSQSSIEAGTDSTPITFSDNIYHPSHPLTLNPATNTNTTAPPLLLGVSVSRVLMRLDALLMVLKTCKGMQCTHPWLQLHPSPDAGVHCLRDALSPRFDDFYETQVKRVVFEQCEQAYVLESEGAVWDPRDGLMGMS